MTTYYRCNSRNNHLHTDTDCSRLQKAKSYRTVSRELFPNTPICTVCAGEVEGRHNQDFSFHQALLEAGEE